MLNCNVPYDSVVGPSLFRDSSSHVRDIEYHFCANDIQVYLFFPHSDEAEALSKLALRNHAM